MARRISLEVLWSEGKGRKAAGAQAVELTSFLLSSRRSSQVVSSLDSYTPSPSSTIPKTSPFASPRSPSRLPLRSPSDRSSQELSSRSREAMEVSRDGSFCSFTVSSSPLLLDSLLY